MTHRFGMRLLAGAAMGAMLAACAAPQTQSNDDSSMELDIPYEKRVLDNGLTVIAHEDTDAPVVAVNVWYHVGSKNEPEGRSGFAHLFEHLMFNGSENYDDDYFKPFDRVGATGMNGTTNFDRTNYFQVVPRTALDLALWMESDRMGHLLGAIDQDKLDEQRGVVQNEKRQGENRPYGQVFNLIIDNLFPEGHPYDHSVIGSMEDLNAASLDDVHEWFENYYGAANATIVVAGDIDPEEAFNKVERYFGDIPAGPPVDTPKAMVPQLDDSTRVVHEDRVPQTRIYKVWPVPGYGEPEADMLELTADVLADGQNSRLYERLVYDEQIASDVGAYLMRSEVTGMLLIQVSVAQDADAAEVEAALNEEIDRLIAEGPTASELERIQASSRSEFLRGLERVGGFGGKSDVLARNEVFMGSPDAWEDSVTRIMSAGTEDVHSVASEWLSRNHFTLEVRPFPDYTTTESEVDRSAGLPEVNEFPEGDFPDVQRMTLDNGLEVVLAERHTLPVVNFNLQVDAGYAADQFSRAGTAKLTMNLIDQGTGELSALEISEQLDLLGAQLSTGANIDRSYVSLSALRSNLDASLDLFSNIVREPSFPAEELERQRSQMLASLSQEMNQPQAMALRVFPRQLFGDEHAYGQPLTGSGTRESVQNISLEEIRDHHATWFRPNNATLVVAGDITLDELRPRLERLFDDWQAGDVPEKELGNVAMRNGGTVYLVDRPDAEQSMIIAGHVAPPKGGEDELAIEAMNEVLGGSFNARMNMNLREDKGWSYGARTVLQDTAAQRPFFAFAPVQTDKTAESMNEIISEFRGIVGDEPPEADEVSRAKDTRTKTLPGRWETISAVADDLGQIVRFDLSDDYWDTYARRVNNLERADVVEAAETVVHPDNIVWVVVGDRARVEDEIRELGYDIEYVDANGDPVEQ